MLWSYCCSETSTGVLDAGSTLAEDKGLVKSVDIVGRRWGDGITASRRCSCKPEPEATDTSESDSDDPPPDTTLYLRENAAGREFTTASWRENAKKKPQVGPPDTRLFATGLATLTSQLPKSHPAWYTMKAEWEQKVRAAHEDPRDAERQAALASIRALSGSVKTVDQTIQVHH
eukprot:symbB.v1.2.029426.t1/scaffold3153.1/size62324/5